MDTRTKTMRTLSYDDMLTEGTENFRVPSVNGEWYRISSTRKVEAQPVQCISVDSEDHLYAIDDGILTHNTGGGKSVLQRNILFSIIAHSKDIKFLGIDLKQVELSGYTIFKDACLGVGTTLEDALVILNFANDTMQQRYSEMKKTGKNDFKTIPGHGPAILVMVDEAGQLLDMSGSKAGDAAKAEGDLKAEAQSIIGQIARLGRAAGVHLAIATQRPDAKMIPGELKENLMFRAGCGHLTSIASSMLFDDNTGVQTPADPKGRAAIMTVGQKPQKVQVYYTPDFDWMVKWMERHGMNPDGTPLETGPSVDMGDSMDRIKNGGNADDVLGIDTNDAVEEEVRKRQAIADAHDEAVRRMSASAVDDESDSTDDKDGTDTMSLGRPKIMGDKGVESKPDHREDWDDVMDDIIDD